MNIYFFSITMGSEWDSWNLRFHIKSELSLENLCAELKRRGEAHLKDNPSLLEEGEYLEDQVLFTPYPEQYNYEFPLHSCVSGSIRDYITPLNELEYLEVKNK